MVKAHPGYRPIGTAMWRASAFGPLDARGDWPGDDGNTVQWREWIAVAWGIAGVADAISHASPALAAQVSAVLDEGLQDERRLTRTGYAWHGIWFGCGAARRRSDSSLESRPCALDQSLSSATYHVLKCGRRPALSGWLRSSLSLRRDHGCCAICRSARTTW